MDRFALRATLFDTACGILGRTSIALGAKLSRPVFIIGTGRCGTTLLVKILKSHPGLSGFPDEANELWHPKLEPFESTALEIPPIEIAPDNFTEVSIANWPSGHGDTIRRVFTGFHVITGPSKLFFTKSAMVSFMIPKILELFPDAKFIHIYRFGPSVVESYFKKNFGKYSRHAYSEDEYRRYCARYWNSCILEIERQKRALSLDVKGQFLEFSYEALCDTPTATLSELTKFLGADATAFRYDTSRIVSENAKAPDYASDPARVGLLDVMRAGMELKGYLANR